MAISEALLTTNNFNMPKVLTGNDAKVILITRLIMLEPGRILGMPINAGVGLVSRYRFITEDKLNSLKNEIETQISKYIPDAQGAEVTVEFKDTTNFNEKKIMIIGIRIGSYIYAVGTDGENIYQNVEDENPTTVTLADLLS